MHKGIINSASFVNLNLVFLLYSLLLYNVVVPDFLKQESVDSTRGRRRYT